MYNVMLITLLIVTSLMIIIILLQKNDGNSSVLGSSGSSGMFSARGTANLLTRITSVLAAIFLSLCVLMMWHSAHYSAKPKKLFEQTTEKVQAKTKDQAKK